jgi:hypothetical protein
MLKALQILHILIVLISIVSFGIVLVMWCNVYEASLSFLVLSYTANAWLGPRSVCYLTYLEGKLKGDIGIEHFSVRLLNGDLFKEWKNDVRRRPNKR